MSPSKPYEKTISQLPKPLANKVKKINKNGLAEERTTNRLHPVHVEYSYPIGVRIDMDRTLPLDLMEEDPDELLDLLASPPEHVDRLAPLSCQLNGESVTGLNPEDLLVKFMRQFSSDLGKVAKEMEMASKGIFGERAQVSCFGLGLDPDTICRIIESDYDHADNVYSRLMELMENGFVTPIVTTPFHSLLPLYQHDFEIRLVVRLGLEFYWPLLKKYNRFVAKNLGEKYFIAVFWLPEGAINQKVVEILHQEFVKRCEAEKIEPCHLVLLLDTEQSKDRENDLLMKRWNTMRPAPTTRDIISLMFKEQAFSEWVVTGHPSTKKQLDRTIAKVDAALREQKIDHLWSHFESVQTLLSTFKTCNNFEQKLLKLTELAYQPCGPDVFVRRKLLNVFEVDENEPRRSGLEPMTCWNPWPDQGGASMVRFRGVEEIGGLRPKRILGEGRPYTQKLPDGSLKEHQGSQCWKPALMGALQRVHRAVVGEPKTFMGGMLGLIREMLPYRRIPVAMRNVEEFLITMSRVMWKEHFIHHVYSEADIQLLEICQETLLKGVPESDLNEDGELSDEDCITFGTAAHAIYHAHWGLGSPAFAFENIDNRAVYHNVTMMTLAVVHAVAAYRWNDREEQAQQLFDVFKEELLNFDGAYERHGLATLGVDRETWQQTIASEVPFETELNVVERAARKVAAGHLRKLGFRSEFDRKDSFISTAVGHIWSAEIDHLNYKWENEAYCGMQEE